MKNTQKNDSLRWLYITIIAAALIAIVIILIIDNTKPKEGPSSSGTTYLDSSKTNSQSENSNNSNEDSSTTPTTKSDTETSSSSTPTQSTPTSSNVPTSQPVKRKCYHEEAGVCWDDLEDEYYSAGLYDSEYGYHGASYNEPDNCDTICRDILEDAYEEGWADGR